MGRLHPITLSALVVVFVHNTALPADYCSLKVRVVSPDGRRPLAIVPVREKNGRHIDHDPTSEDVDFCDLGIEPVTVKVGADGTCNQVTVADVPLSWQEQYLLNVTYDIEPCVEEAPPTPVPTCKRLFRISDKKGAWLGGASVQFTHPVLPLLVADSAGRALLVMKAGATINGTISAEGYVSRKLSVTCSPFTAVHEEVIELDRSPIY